MQLHIWRLCWQWSTANGSQAQSREGVREWTDRKNDEERERERAFNYMGVKNKIPTPSMDMVLPPNIL
jgi:hypothetical protein